MRLGVWYDFRNPRKWRQPWSRLYDELLEQCTWADQLGFDSIWLSEHHFTDDGYLPAVAVMLAAIASRTERVRLGTAVLLTPLHHPLRLAEDLAVVDLVSHGRLDVGLAVGYRSKEFELLGIPRAERGIRTEESIQILRKAWTGEPFSFDGRTFNFHEVVVTPVPFQQPSPPIWIGGSSSAAARRAGRLGCGFLADSDCPVELFDVYREAFVQVESGLATPKVTTNRLVFASQDPERAWSILGPHLLYQRNIYAEWGAESEGRDLQGVAFQSPSELRRANYLVDTPAGLVSSLRQLADEGNLEEVHFWARPPGLSIEESNASLELIAHEVLPKLHLSPSESPRV